MALKIPVSMNRSEAMILEKHLKDRKSRSFLENLISRQPDTNYLLSLCNRVLLKKGRKNGQNGPAFLKKAGLIRRS